MKASFKCVNVKCNNIKLSILQSSNPKSTPNLNPKLFLNYWCKALLLILLFHSHIISVYKKWRVDVQMTKSIVRLVA